MSQNGFTFLPGPKNLGQDLYGKMLEVFDLVASPISHSGTRVLEPSKKENSLLAAADGQNDSHRVDTGCSDEQI